MKLTRLSFLFWLLFGGLSIQAQDVHFSLFHMSPLTLNPAHTGAFSGTVRIGGIYRDQWASFLNNQFTTPSFYADAPIIRGLGKNDWVGVGVAFYRDKAGSLELGTNTFMFSGAYHRALDKDGETVLTLGAQFAQSTRGLNYDNILLGSAVDFSQPNPRDAGIGNVTTDPGLPAGNSSGGSSEGFDRDKGFGNINVGLMLRSRLNDDANLEVGIAFNSIGGPKYNLLDSPEAERPMFITGHGRLRYQLNEDWSITPGFLFRTVEGTKPEIGLQSWLGRKINDEFTLNFGAGYRFSDAAQVLAGVDFLEDLRVALSYDINLSSLSEATNSYGGFELSAYYIIRLYKKPSADPAILCPKF